MCRISGNKLLANCQSIYRNHTDSYILRKDKITDVNKKYPLRGGLICGKKRVSQL